MIIGNLKELKGKTLCIALRQIDDREKQLLSCNDAEQKIDSLMFNHQLIHIAAAGSVIIIEVVGMGISLAIRSSALKSASKESCKAVREVLIASAKSLYKSHRNVTQVIAILSPPLIELLFQRWVNAKEVGREWGWARIHRLERKIDMIKSLKKSNSDEINQFKMAQKGIERIVDRCKRIFYNSSANWLNATYHINGSTTYSGSIPLSDEDKIMEEYVKNSRFN